MASNLNAGPWKGGEVVSLRGFLVLAVVLIMIVNVVLLRYF